MKARLSHLVENGLPILLDFVDACGGENWDWDFSKYGAMSLGYSSGVMVAAAVIMQICEKSMHGPAQTWC